MPVQNAVQETIAATDAVRQEFYGAFNTVKQIGGEAAWHDLCDLEAAHNYQVFLLLKAMRELPKKDLVRFATEANP